MVYVTYDEITYHILIKSIHISRNVSVFFVSQKQDFHICNVVRKTMDEIITLNVGGKRFYTRKSTLCKFPDTMLGKMFTTDISSHKEEDGSYFLDRDWKYFDIILNYYRNGKFAEDVQFTPSFLMELDYWMIPCDEPYRYWEFNDAMKYVSGFGYLKSYETLRLIVRLYPNSKQVYHLSRSIDSITKIITPFKKGTYASYNSGCILKSFTPYDHHLLLPFLVGNDEIVMHIEGNSCDHIDMLCEFYSKSIRENMYENSYLDKGLNENDLFYHNGTIQSVIHDNNKILKKLDDLFNK